MRMTAADWGLLVLLSVLWGGSFFFVAVAVRDVPPLTVVLCRVGLAAAALAVYLRIKGVAMWPHLRVAAGAFLVMGVLNNIMPFSLLFWAQTEITSGLASILNATTPIFAAVTAHFVLADERMAPAKAVGIGLGFAGVVVLMGGGGNTGGWAVLGMTACLGAAFSYGLASVYGRRFRAMAIPDAVVALGQLTASTLMMTPLALAIDRPWAAPIPGTVALAAIVGLALVSTALAYVVYFRILRRAGAVNITLVTLMVPASAIVLGTLVLGEMLALHQAAGMALIAIGLAALDGRFIGLLRRRCPRTS